MDRQPPRGAPLRKPGRAGHPPLAQLIADTPARLWRTLRTWPHQGGWIACAEIAAVTLALMALIGFATGFYRLGAVNLTGMPLRLLTVLIVPALGEEAVFRGALLPDQTETHRPVLWLAISTALYVAWHPLEALTFLPAAAPIFLRPDFLAVTAVLGLGCGLMRLRTGSLWPAVALHWLLVTLWQTFLGAPTLDQLRPGS